MVSPEVSDLQRLTALVVINQHGESSPCGAPDASEAHLGTCRSVAFSCRPCEQGTNQLRSMSRPGVRAGNRTP